jgi:hypothetical protein
MIVKSKFPFTENPVAGGTPQQSSDLASAQSVRIYTAFSSISLSDHLSISRRLLLQQVGRVGQTERIGKNEQLIEPITAIPENSPIYLLESLQKGWDGYWAEPLSSEVLLRAHELWLAIDGATEVKGTLPTVRASANGAVAFTWSCDYPEKELEIWLYDQPEYYAEWMLSVGNADEEGTAQTQSALLSALRQYQES